MKLGIYDINTNTDLDYKQRLDIIKQTGFKEVSLFIDQKYMSKDENYADIINYAKQIGLKVCQVHADYKISNQISDDTNVFFDYMDKKIKECVDFGIKNVVFHASSGFNAPLIPEKQLNKIKEIAKKYEKYDVNICFENVKDNSNLEKILNLNASKIKMCFDLGHAYCYDNIDTLFDKFKHKIACTHLHNNYGTDDHNVLNDGEIDYKKFLVKLSAIDNCCNSLECFPGKNKTLNLLEYKDFIKKCYNSVN